MTVTTLRRLLAPLAAALFALLLAVAGATAASADTVPAPTNPSGFLRVGTPARLRPPRRRSAGRNRFLRRRR